MSTYAIVDGSGVVQNVVTWDGDTTKWQPSAGSTAVLVPPGTAVSPGWTYSGGVFTFGQTPAQVATAALLAKLANVEAVVPTLRQWATDAAGTTVTAANTVAVLQTVVTRFGTVCDRLADWIQATNPGS